MLNGSLGHMMHCYTLSVPSKQRVPKQLSKKQNNLYSTYQQHRALKSNLLFRDMSISRNGEIHDHLKRSCALVLHLYDHFSSPWFIGTSTA